MTQADKDQRDLIRQLGGQVAQVAAGAENALIRRRWRDVNALRRPDRAPVWCRPMGCWKEILPQESLVCWDPELRQVEYALRQTLYKHNIGDDSPVEPYFAVPAVFDVHPANVWGVDLARRRPEEEDGAWGFAPALNGPADFDRLAMPAYSYNPEQTQRRCRWAEDLLGDSIPVKVTAGPGFDSGTLGTDAAELRGLEQMMLDSVLEPWLLHKLMRHVRDARIGLLDEWEACGLLTPNNTGPMICSDPLGPPAINGRFTLKNCWCAANSQEFDAVSPKAWEEFCLNYQRPIFERFGLVCYGCCENLTGKIDAVLSIPNLRIFVCSAWTSLEVVLNRIDVDYVIMWRQKAGDVVFAEDVSAVRRGLEEGVRRLQGRCYQIVLRELQTLAGHPDRLHVWTDMAKELAAKYA